MDVQQERQRFARVAAGQHENALDRCSVLTGPLDQLAFPQHDLFLDPWIRVRKANTARAIGRPDPHVARRIEVLKHVGHARAVPTERARRERAQCGSHFDDVARADIESEQVVVGTLQPTE